MSLQSRITVLLGAGAVLELTPKGITLPTTANITSQIMKDDLDCVEINPMRQFKSNLLVRIYEHLCNHYYPAIKEEKINFELLMHVLELLFSYRYIWRGDRSPIDPCFSSFICPVREFDFVNGELYAASEHLIETIFKMVMAYDIPFMEERNAWYIDFWKGNAKGWDVFNLNYDTTVEQSLELYEDGYEAVGGEEHFQRFNVRRLLENQRELSTINHLHGCISYGMSRYKDINHDAYEFDFHDMYKWESPMSAYNIFKSSSTSNDVAQNGHTIFQGPIITGLSKTDKVVCLPYDAYRTNFMNSTCRNRGLLIAGYSFSDKYVNHIINRMSQLHGINKRVVLIDYWNLKSYIAEYSDGECGEKYNDDYLSASIFENLFEHKLCKNEMLLFIKRMVHHDTDVWRHFNRLSMSKPMISDNGQFMLCIGGMKNTLVNHADEIMSFLSE